MYSNDNKKSLREVVSKSSLLVLYICTFFALLSCQQDVLQVPVQPESEQVRTENQEHAFCELVPGLALAQTQSDANKRTSKKKLYYDSKPYDKLGKSHIVIYVWELISKHNYRVQGQPVSPDFRSSFKREMESKVRTALKDVVPSSNVVFVYIRSEYPEYYEDFKSNVTHTSFHSVQLRSFRDYVFQNYQYSLWGNEFHVLLSNLDWNGGRTAGAASTLMPSHFMIVGCRDRAFAGTNNYLGDYHWVSNARTHVLAHELGHCFGVHHVAGDAIMASTSAQGTKFTNPDVRRNIHAGYSRYTSIVEPSSIRDLGTIHTGGSSSSKTWHGLYIHTYPNTPTPTDWDGRYNNLNPEMPTYFKFQVSERALYAFETQWGYTYDTYLYLLDDGGNLIGENDDRNWGSNRYESFISYQILDPSRKYYLVVAGYPYPRGWSGHYRSYGSCWTYIWRAPIAQRRRLSTSKNELLPNTSNSMKAPELYKKSTAPGPLPSKPK